MADDADLLITAGFSDAKMAAEMKKVEAKFAQAGEKAQKAFNQTAEKAVANSQVVKANAREIDNLKRKYDPLYAASKRYEAELDKLNRAQAVGAINAKQHAAALDRLNAEFESAGTEMGRAAGQARNYGGKLQQVGFQVGDFATQVGSGTSAVQALGQQLPQLLGAFGTFGALAGAGAAIFIPLGAALVRTAFDVESLEDRTEALTKSTDAYVSAAQAAATPVDQLREKFGDLADEVARVNETTALISGAAAKANLEAASKAFSEQFGGLGSRQVQNPYGQFLSDSTFSEIERTAQAISREFGITEEQALSVARAMRALGQAGSDGPEALTAAGADLNDVLIGIAGTADEAQKKFGELLSGEGGLGAILEQAARQVEAAASAEIQEENRLLDTYDKNARQLAKLAEDRASAERLLAQAVIDGNQEKIDSYARVLDAIDGEVVGIKTAIAELDGSLDAFIERMKSRAGQIGGTINDMVRSLTGVGVGGMIAAGVNASERVQANQGTAELLKQFEGFRSKAYWDVNAYRAGFGSDTVTLSDGSIQRVTEGMTVTLEQANRDLERRIFEFQSVVIGQVGQGRWGEFNQGQQSALTSIAYNYGSLPDRILEAVRSGSSQDIANAIGGLAGDNAGINSNRRMREASAFGDTSLSSEALSEQTDALKEQAKEMQRKLDLVKQFGEQLSSNLLTEQQTAELAKQRAEQIAAINAQDISDDDKAAAIAQVNAEMDRQTTILKLMEEAKRRNVDLDAQMTGSTLTYRQAIEQLGAAQYEQSLASQEAKRGTEEFSDAQKFAADQQRQFEEGLVNAIVAADNFGDALKNLVVQLIAAQAQALLMAGLFDSGAYGGGSGGGLLGAISKLFGFSQGGYTGNIGTNQVAGVVHGGEYVMSAAAVQRIGLPNLEAIHQGRSVGGAVNFAPSTTINIEGGADERTLTQIRRELDVRDARIKSQVPGIMQTFQRRAG